MSESTHVVIFILPFLIMIFTTLNALSNREFIKTNKTIDILVIFIAIFIVTTLTIYHSVIPESKEYVEASNNKMVLNTDESYTYYYKSEKVSNNKANDNTNDNSGIVFKNDSNKTITNPKEPNTESYFFKYITNNDRVIDKKVNVDNVTIIESDTDEAYVIAYKRIAPNHILGFIDVIYDDSKENPYTYELYIPKDK